MKTVELDLTGCRYPMQIHTRIKEAFDFPDYYGHNWDAFCDFLWSECDVQKVIIKGERGLPKELDEDITIMYECLNEKVKNAKQYNELFTYETVS